MMRLPCEALDSFQPGYEVRWPDELPGERGNLHARVAASSLALRREPGGTRLPVKKTHLSEEIAGLEGRKNSLSSVLVDGGVEFAGLHDEHRITRITLFEDAFATWHVHRLEQVSQ